MELIDIDNELYIYEHLLRTNNNLQSIENFTVGHSACGLERYLKEDACNDESNNMARTYLIRDKNTNEIAAYFWLKAGSIALKAANNNYDSIPAMELSNFAVNDSYKVKHENNKGIGSYVFFMFVLPIVKYMGQLVGVNSLYVYALPEDSLINYYQKLGFSRLSKENETYINSYVKPDYDDKCIFMYQNL